MTREVLDTLLAQIRAERELTLAALADVDEGEFSVITPMERWNDVRRVLLRFGDHLREHANQIEGTRESIGRNVTMAQRILAEGEVAWGKLLAATIDLDDEAIGTPPPGGGWSIQQVLEHILVVERGYREVIMRVRDK
jgi:hypothetical protein